MKKVTTIVRNLDQLSTYITDQSSLSSNIFNITEFPLEFTIGKNLIKLKGNSNIFEIGTELAIEILDSNRNPIYHEIIDYIESDTSRVLAVYIYDTTPPGNCTVTIAAVLNQLYTGEQIPNNWRNKLNVKWTKNISVNNKATNTSEIIFEDTKLPTVEVSEQIGVRLDRLYENNEQFPTYTTGLIEFETKNNSTIAKITGGEFDPKFSGGTLTVAAPVNALPIPLLTTSSIKPYTSKIKKILNKDFIELNDRYVFTYSQSLTQHEFIKFDPSPFSLSYEAVPTYVPTQHSESFALTQIKNLNPGTGDVSRIKLYINSSGTIGTYELINDISLESTEIFVDSTGSIFPDISIGYFTSQSIIDSYWEVNQYSGKLSVTKPTLTFSTSSLNNSIVVTPSVSYSGDQNAIILQTTSSLPGVFVKDSEYKIIFDAIGTKNSLSNLENPKISIYLSGSAFDYDTTNLQNDYFPYILGKKIGEYETPNNNQRLDDLQFNFIADKTGNGSLLIVIESGQWQFSDIRTLTSAETGYTENYTRFRTDIPVKHKSDNEIKFKIEYYNAAGVKSDHETIVSNKTFQGGNRYIDGGFSMLTGSLTVADTLNSGVEIVGLQNTGYIRSLGYDGFNQAMTGRGGFLLFSGSALPNQFATSYQGVGLEMVANANNFFKFRTDPSALEIQTEKFFLGNPATQFISGSNGQLEISSSGYHIQPTGDITASNFLMEGGVITNNVTILGSVSANSILTPAVINGNPATPANASSSISDQGLAIFRSASIAGFNISPEEIRSPGDALRLKSIGQITASSGFLFGSKAASNFIQFAGSTLTVRGDLSVDQIFTPALIGGNPSNETNASSSIKSDGFAKFVSASIGGWGITTSSIEGGNLIMKPEGILQTKDFASGFKGWKISSEGNGTAEFENVRIRGTLRTTTFEKESVNAVGGQLWVTNATTLTGSNITANATTMSVENASGFTPGEILLAKKVDATGFQTEYLLVESASVDGNNTGSDEVHGRLFVQRGYGSGSQGSFVGDLASTSQSYDEGQVIVSTGLSGSGYIKMNANPRDSNTPFIDIVERTGSGLYDVELRSRLGDLSGLANSSYVFGNPSPGFGLATDNVFLQGGIIARTGSIGGIEMESNKLYIGAGNHANSDTGFYVDSGSNFSLGDKLTWDGSALTVRGQLRLEDGKNVQDAINEATASNTAKTLILTSDSQVMAFDSASDNTATPSNIIFSIAQQNLTASISASNITITTAQSTNVTGFDFDTGSITTNSAGLYSGIVSGSITFAGALTAGGLETDKDNFPVSITVNGDSLTDTTSLFKVQGGATGSDGTPGADGTDAVTTFLTNESHTFSADSSGTISSFLGGNTDMEVFEGVTNKTSAYSFGRVNGVGVSSNIVNNTVTVTGLTGDTGSIAITATSASTSLTKTMSLAKSKTGESGSTAKTLTLTSDSQVFSFASASATNALDDDILIIFNQQNLSGPIVSGDITIKDSNNSTLSNPTLKTDVTNGSGQVSGSITFSGTVSGNKTKLPLTIEVTKDSLSDTTRIFKLDGGSSGSDGSDGSPGADGAPAVTAFLTNESHTFPADQSGTVSSFADGVTDMIVFVGLTNSTSSFTYARTNSTGVTSTLSGTDGNTLTINSMAHDSGSVDITATSASVSVTKTMTLAKSKQGTAGAAGATGATGPNFDFLTGSISEVDTTGGLNAGLLMTSNVLGFHGNIAAGDGTNATINDFVTFLDSSGNFFIGSASAGHFAYSQTTGELLVSGSKVDIRTPKFFLGSTNNQFVSGANGNIEISSSKFHVKPDGDVIVRKVSAEEGTIGGFVISADEVRSINNRLRLKDNGQITGSVVLFDGGKVGGFNIDNHSLTSTGVEINDSSQTLFISSSAFKVDHTGNITGSQVLFEGGRITSGVTIEGSVTANAIRTPATIGGSPSTDTNASSSIKSDGFATFKSASIAGFEITTDEISGGFIPASSSILNTVVSASLQLDGTLETFSVSVDSFTTNAAGGAAFWEAYRQAGNTIFIKSNNGASYYNVGESSTNTFRANSSVAGANITINNGFVETGFSNQPHTIVDSGGSTLTVVSSSTQIFTETPAPLLLKSNGQITASSGEIGGFAITSTAISSSNDNLILKSSGNITASNALFNGRVTAQQFTEKTVKVTNSNQSSYLRSVTGGKNLVFDGSLGGDIVMNMIIAVPAASAFVIKDIELPNTGSASNVTSTSVNVIIQTVGIQFDTADISEELGDAFPLEAS